METHILNEFLVLEELNNFSKAAKELQMSQATLSRHIMQLEEECGVTLFDRTTQKMKLTAYGRSLTAYAKEMLESEHSFKRDIENISYKNSTHLCIGSIDFPFYYGITGQLAEFKKENPSASLEVMIDTTDNLLTMLKSGQVDVAFLRNIENCLDSFDANFFCEDYMMIVVPIDHPMSRYNSATLQQFADDTFYRRYKKNSLADKLFQKMLEDADITPLISASQATWEDSVISDLTSVTTCFGGLADTFKGNLHLKVLTLEPKTHADIYLAAMNEKSRPDLTNKFLEFVRRQSH